MTMPMDYPGTVGAEKQKWQDPVTGARYKSRPWWYGFSETTAALGQSSRQVGSWFGGQAQQSAQGFGKSMISLAPPFMQEWAKGTGQPQAQQGGLPWKPQTSGKQAPFQGFSALWPEESQSNAGFSPEYTQKLEGIRSKQSILDAIYPLASQAGMNKYDLDRMTGILGVAIEDLDVNDLMAILNELKQRTSQPEETGGLTPQQRATYEKQQAVQRRAGGTPDTDQADALRKAQIGRAHV